MATAPVGILSIDKAYDPAQEEVCESTGGTLPSQSLSSTLSIRVVIARKNDEAIQTSGLNPTSHNSSVACLSIRCNTLPFA